MIANYGWVRLSSGLVSNLFLSWVGQGFKPALAEVNLCNWSLPPLCKCPTNGFSFRISFRICGRWSNVFTTQMIKCVYHADAQTYLPRRARRRPPFGLLWARTALRARTHTTKSTRRTIMPGRERLSFVVIPMQVLSAKKSTTKVGANLALRL